MKKKIIVSLGSFVVLCIAIGAISIVKKSNANADSNPAAAEALVVNTTESADAVTLAFDTEIPSCDTGTTGEVTPLTTSTTEESLSTENIALENCFPLESSDDISLAKRRRYYSQQSKPRVTTPATVPPKVVTTPTLPTSPAVTTPTPVVTTPVVPTTPVTPIVTQPVTPPVTQPTQVQPSGNISWGAYLPDASTSSIKSFESQVGAQMDIVATFAGWGNGASDFPEWLGSALLPTNKTLLIFWETTANGQAGNVNQPKYNYDSIINGSWDSYVTTFAKAAKKYGGKVIIIPFDEMNGDWYPWSGTKNGNTPAKHNAAYKHLHDLFAAENVTNVKWGWAPNSMSIPNTSANAITNYYPGDAYVDYVGLDGFNFNTQDDPWQSFGQLFNSAITSLSAYKKPIYIFSMATAEANDGGTKKAAWITDALTQMKNDPRIGGFVWFNENKEQNWLINSTSKALQAFSNIIKTY